jgi:beta-barrel assembly-enhancing protease
MQTLKSLGSSLLMLCVLFAPSALAQKKQKPKEIKPGRMIFFGKDKDVQLGQEAAADMEKQLEIINDPELTAYINKLGKKIASQPQADTYPYQFKVVNDPAINAFALPGGFCYVNTGLLTNSDNEGQLMGVIAHEIAHVALRHGASNMSKSMLWQGLLGAGGAVGGGMWGQLIQAAGGMGAQLMLLRYSRDAEKQSDLLGSRMMAQAGYNPIEMARFFEKLEGEGGSRGSQLMSSHPNPGNRSKYVQEEILMMAQRNYNGADENEFQRMKAKAKGIAPPVRKPGQGSPVVEPPVDSDGLRTFKGQVFNVRYPGAWSTLGDADGMGVTVAPKEGLRQTQQGGVEIGAGVMIDFFQKDPKQAGGHRKLTEELLAGILKSNPGIDRNVPALQETNLRGMRGLTTRMVNKSPIDGGREIDQILSFERPDGIVYVILIYPESQQRGAEQFFAPVLNSLNIIQ